MSKNKKEYLTLNIVFETDSSNELKKNAEYRHWLYNKGVEFVKDKQCIDSNNHILVNSNDILKYLRKFEIGDSVSKRPGYLEPYDYYFRGISENVAKDISRTCKRVVTERSKGNSSDIRFMKYDPNNLSFSFKANKDKIKKDSIGIYTSNRLFLTENPFIIGLKINNVYSKRNEYFGLKLKENIHELFTKYNVTPNSIEDIRIVFHNDIWHLNLVCDFTEQYKNSRKNSKSIFDKKEVAGIDLGIKNPVVIYDNDGFVNIPENLKFPKEKVELYSRRISKIQSVLDQKIKYSNNYFKVLAKLHKYYQRKHDVVKDWHYKLSYWIVTNYDNIVVDEFHDYIIEKSNKKYSERVRKDINGNMYDKSLGIFTIILKHMAHKYGCKYYEAKPLTTKTCNNCGYVNKDFELFNDDYTRNDYIKCFNCGHKIDVDDNAAINCYIQFTQKSKRDKQRK